MSDATAGSSTTFKNWTSELQIYIHRQIERNEPTSNDEALPQAPELPEDFKPLTEEERKTIHDYKEAAPRCHEAVPLLQQLDEAMCQCGLDMIGLKLLHDFKEQLASTG
eukprot:2515930-Amphidinium_carterae.1